MSGIDKDRMKELEFAKREYRKSTCPKCDKECYESSVQLYGNCRECENKTKDETSRCPSCGKKAGKEFLSRFGGCLDCYQKGWIKKPMETKLNSGTKSKSKTTEIKQTENKKKSSKKKSKSKPPPDVVTRPKASQQPPSGPAAVVSESPEVSSDVKPDPDSKLEFTLKEHWPKKYDGMKEVYFDSMNSFLVAFPPGKRVGLDLEGRAKIKIFFMEGRGPNTRVLRLLRPHFTYTESALLPPHPHDNARTKRSKLEVVTVRKVMCEFTAERSVWRYLGQSLSGYSTNLLETEFPEISSVAYRPAILQALLLAVCDRFGASDVPTLRYICTKGHPEGLVKCCVVLEFFNGRVQSKAEWLKE